MAEIVNPLDPGLVPLLDPEFVTYYNRTAALKPATHQIPLSEVRTNPAKWAGPWCKDFTGERGVINRKIPSKDGYEVPIRIYNPIDEDKFGKGPFPVHVNYHGGGFVFGDLTADAEFCMLLRNEVGLMVVDVDYRLCPEHRFGKNIEDSWAALEWVQKNAAELNVKPESMSVSGISAGGHLAAVMQHMARDAGIKTKLAILSVPTTDYTTYFPFPADSKPTASAARLINAPYLTASRLAYFQKNVFPPEHQDFILSELPVFWRTPLHAPNFKDVCETYIATAEVDPLCDEGEAYGRKVLEAGGKVTFRRYLGVPHPFTHMTANLKQAVMYDDDVCKALRTAHNL